MQRVQGSVIISALISESGRVLETKVIRGGQLGLTEAADQSVRRSSFAPGEKDGVRVKSWTTVSVDFKL
jgi:TonB family protein